MTMYVVTAFVIVVMLILIVVYVFIVLRVVYATDGIDVVVVLGLAF